MYGSWRTKLGAILTVVPHLIDALTPVIPDSWIGVASSIGLALMGLGIRRGVSVTTSGTAQQKQQP